MHTMSRFLNKLRLTFLSTPDDVGTKDNNQTRQLVVKKQKPDKETKAKSQDNKTLDHLLYYGFVGALFFIAALIALWAIKVVLSAVLFAGLIVLVGFIFTKMADNVNKHKQNDDKDKNDTEHGTRVQIKATVHHSDDND